MRNRTSDYADFRSWQGNPSKSLPFALQDFKYITLPAIRGNDIGLPYHQDGNKFILLFSGHRIITTTTTHYYTHKFTVGIYR